MKQLHWIFGVWFWTFSFLVVEVALVGQESAPILGSRKTALVVGNRAGEEFTKFATQLEDKLSSRAASPGLVFIGRQLATDAIAKEGAAAQLDALVSERTSALRLAQPLGADWVLLVCLSSFMREGRTFNDGNLQLTSHNHVLRFAYKIAEAAKGGVWPVTAFGYPETSGALKPQASNRQRFLTRWWMTPASACSKLFLVSCFRLPKPK
jgi:hypothetical protein